MDDPTFQAEVKRQMRVIEQADEGGRCHGLDRICAR